MTASLERLELLALAHAVYEPQSEHTRRMTTGMLTDATRRTCLSIALAWGSESSEPLGSTVLEARLAERGIPLTAAQQFVLGIEAPYVGLVGQDPAQFVHELQRHADERHARELAQQGAMAAVRGDIPAAIERLTEANAIAGSDGAPWPEPSELPALPAVTQWSDDLLPSALRPWLADVAARTQCPPEYAAVGAMVSLGSVIGRGCAIRPKRCDDWTVVPNLWGALIGPPSAMKSPALREALRPLRLLASEASAHHESCASQREVYDAQVESARKALRVAAAKGHDTLALQVAYDDACKAALESRHERRYVVNDSTVEKLGEILRSSPRGVLLYRDELVGWLSSLDKQGHESDRAFYLECWDGTDSFVWDRIDRGTVRIEAACVSLIGGIQPGPLAAYLSAAMSGGSGADGLIQRLQLAVYPDTPRTWAVVDSWPDTAARLRAVELYRRMAAITPTEARAELSDGIPFVRFDAAAQPLFDRWLTDLMRRARSGDEHEALESHLVKFSSLMPSIALICQLADHGHGPVGVESADRAVAWCSLLESHARRIYASASAGAHSSARALLAKLRAGKLQRPFTARDIYRAQWSGLSEPSVVTAAISTLESYGWLRCITMQTTGRPRTEIHAHPALARGGNGH